MHSHSSLSAPLQEVAHHLREKAASVGLDPFTTIFELVDYRQLNEVAAYGGFPTRYPHWRWGMEYERLAKSYTYGLSVIYEMVINNDPCYAYLLRSNSMVAQKTVIAHVYGHGDFFKNNYWFSKTNRKMLDQMANHANTVRRIINEVGHDETENFIDVCLSLENLIDVHAAFRAPNKHLTQEEVEEISKKPVAKLQAKRSYMDQYMNPQEYLEQQKKKNEEHVEKMQKFPQQPTQDVLKFLLDHAPMASWQKKILEIIRNEAYYFAPQGQTKILNEGWATYWHSKMMTELSPLQASEIVDYCDHYAGVVANHQGQLNPYRLGVSMLRHIEQRWDRGQFGLEYHDIEDYRERRRWDTKVGLGRSKLFEIRKYHNDITFLEEYFDEDFCHESKMFLYDQDERSGKYVIANRQFKEIKNYLLKQLTNLGNPRICVVDGNFHNRGELLLEHIHEGSDLQHEHSVEVLRNLHLVWKRPVYIKTVIDGVAKYVGFDGHNHSVERV
jgi:stage V sporulation protein R